MVSSAVVSDPHAPAEAAIFRAFAKGLRPDPRMTVSEWADRYRMLSSRSAKAHGKWRTDRTPYLREPMDCLSPSSAVNEVVLMFAAQTGKTEAGNNWVGSVVDQTPAPMMIVQATLDLAKRFSRQRLAPIFNESPRLQGKLQDSRSRDSSSNRLEKLFAGGILVLTGANSAAGLRSMPIRYIFFDELDAYPLDVEGEGDPIALAEERTSSFGSLYKTLKCSTPTEEDTSAIERAFKDGDQSHYMVPCPHCAKHQRLEFQNLKWEAGKHKTAIYHCRHCGAGIEERFKPQFLRERSADNPGGAYWQPTNKDGKPGVRSFHLNGLYSPLGMLSWARIAAKWEAAQGKPDKLRVFVNTVLGETWKDKARAPKWERLWNRREQYPRGTAPRGALILTAGVDIQHDRIEVTIIGWGRNGLERWVVDHIVLAGETNQPEVWRELDRLLERQWPHAGGGRMPIRFMAVDCSDQRQTVYAWCRKHSPYQVAPVQGRDSLPLVIGTPQAVEVTEGGRKIARGVKLWTVGSGLLKSRIYEQLALELPGGAGAVPPPGYIHLPEMDEEWLQQLTAERLKTRTIGGFRKRALTEWVKIRERNEALDCQVYGTAAAYIAGIDRFEDEHWRELEVALALVPAGTLPQDSGGTAPPAPPPERTRGRSSYWNRPR